MQLEIVAAGQLELAERVEAPRAVTPVVLPVADEELQVLFRRSHSAWAKWNERKKWTKAAA